MSVGAGSIKRAAKSALTGDVAGTAAQKEKKPRTKAVKAEVKPRQENAEQKTEKVEDQNRIYQIGQQMPVYLL